MAAHVKVVARFRPAHAPGDRIQSGDDAVIVEHKDTQSVSLSRGSDATFTFDHVFPMETTQAHVFEHSIKGTVDDVLQGYNGTIFAYGQTGSGKTYTLMVCGFMLGRCGKA